MCCLSALFWSYNVLCFFFLKNMFCFLFFSVLCKSQFAKMADAEFVKKILRAVLQSSKGGVSIDNLQSEYRSLCGENIPLEKLGFSKLEDYLRSIPSVVKLEYHMGQVSVLLKNVFPLHYCLIKHQRTGRLITARNFY